MRTQVQRLKESRPTIIWDGDQDPVAPKEVKTNRIYHQTVEGKRESHPSVHGLQSTTRFAKSWI